VRRLQIIGVSAVAALYSFMVLDHVEAGDPLTPTVLLLDLLEAALLGLAVLLVALFCVEARERARLRSVLMYDDVADHVKSDVWSARMLNSAHDFSADINRQFRAWDLTEQERDVVINILQGYGDGEIRHNLNLSIAKLERTYRGLRQKTGLQSRDQFAPFFFGKLFDDQQNASDAPNPFRVVSSQEPL